MFSAVLEWADAQPLAPERIISGSPVGRMALGTAPVSATFGQWEGTPGHFTAIPSANDEVVTIISGRGLLRGRDGAEFHLEPGKTFEIPAGYDGEWEIHETIRKAFVFLAPAA